MWELMGKLGLDPASASAREALEYWRKRRAYYCRKLDEVGGPISS